MAKGKEPSWTEVVVNVLRRSAEPLHYTDITKKVIESKLKTDLGRDPYATVKAAISYELSKGNTSEIVRTNRGYYDWSNRPKKITAKEIVENDQTEETGIIDALGVYWERSMIDWNKKLPKLLGKTEAGTIVDFSDRPGIYLLYDRRDIVYVGKTTALGSRLKDHATIDRLKARWDRFSWFSIAEPTSVTETIILTTLEALLVESVEPPLNRQRGEGFKAIEYYQIEDSDLSKKRDMVTLERYFQKMKG